MQPKLAQGAGIDMRVDRHGRARLLLHVVLRRDTRKAVSDTNPHRMLVAKSALLGYRDSTACAQHKGLIHDSFNCG
ncbi:MAG: hypothetical protein GDYSWBUE_000825 [Candidatus Fervidibacterota bacterium]